MRRAIQRLIEDPLADFVLGAELGEGTTIVIDRRAEPGPDGELVDISLVKTPDSPEQVTVPAEEPEALTQPGEDEPADA